jgi:cytidylate kinase
LVASKFFQLSQKEFALSNRIGILKTRPRSTLFATTTVTTAMDSLLFFGSALAIRTYHWQQQQSRSSPTLADILSQQNAATTNTLCDLYATSNSFQTLAAYEGRVTRQRDDEDALKLQLGIDIATNKGVLTKLPKPPTYTILDVHNQTPTQVASVIFKQIGTTPSVVVLCGLSGTGKGTTTTELVAMLQAHQCRVVTWSNGNVFRAVTLLAATWCQQHNKHMKEALTKENIQLFMQCLTFGKFKRNDYDIHIHGLGLDCFVSNVQNTILKSPLVSTQIPTVAEQTQGEVVLFASDAIQRMSAQDGCTVLLEGREQTVNYVPSPHRFTLVLSDETLIGKRRAAQRLMGEAMTKLNNESSKKCTKANDRAVKQVLDECLEKMVLEIKQQEGAL